MRGILAYPIVLHTAEGIIVFPAGCQVAVESNDDWYHDVQDTDICEVIELLEES